MWLPLRSRYWSQCLILLTAALFSNISFFKTQGTVSTASIHQICLPLVQPATWQNTLASPPASFVAYWTKLWELRMSTRTRTPGHLESQVSTAGKNALLWEHSEWGYHELIGRALSSCHRPGPQFQPWNPRCRPRLICRPSSPASSTISCKSGVFSGCIAFSSEGKLGELQPLQAEDSLLWKGCPGLGLGCHGHASLWFQKKLS